MTADQSNIIIYNTIDGKTAVALYAVDGKIWLNQKQLAELFATSIPNINIHISNILKEGELDKNVVIKDYLITASDGKKYNVTFYSLEMILAVGYRVKGKRGTQFRQWATRHLSEYLVKGFTMDDERLKNPNGQPDYFDELLERIRDIRASEKRFYQKIRDLFALSSDYEVREKATQMFYAETQNKLLYAVTHQTAAEIITTRADSEKPNMGLTSWKGAVVRKQDIIVAKNYLTEPEIDMLNRLTTLFLESAEIRVKERKDLTLNFWRENVNGLLSYQGKDVLQGKGNVSNVEMEKAVNGIRACVNKGFSDVFKELDADIFAIQESKIQKDQLILETEGYHQYWNYAKRKGYSGTAVFTKKEPVNVLYGMGIEQHDQEGRLITLDMGEYYFVCVYVPNSQNELKRLDYRMNWEDDFREYMVKLGKEKPVIMCGDLNVAHLDIDLKNPSSNHHNAGFTDEEREKFSELLKAGFTDTFRYMYPDLTDTYSWWSYRFNSRERNAGWRIDYFIVSDSLNSRITDAKIHGDIYGSDHCPVELEIDL